MQIIFFHLRLSCTAPLASLRHQTLRRPFYFYFCWISLKGNTQNVLSNPSQNQVILIVYGKQCVPESKHYMNF